MKIEITKASDWEYSEERDFKTIEDLLDFIDVCGHDLIIEKDRYNKATDKYDKTVITIYDDYVE